MKALQQCCRDGKGEWFFSWVASLLGAVSVSAAAASDEAVDGDEVVGERITSSKNYLHEIY